MTSLREGSTGGIRQLSFGLGIQRFKTDHRLTPVVPVALVAQAEEAEDKEAQAKIDELIRLLHDWWSSSKQT